MSEEAVIAAHLAGDYRVFMYGFAPGYAYLTGVPEAIHLPRKAGPGAGCCGGQCDHRGGAMSGDDAEHADGVVGDRAIADADSDGGCGAAISV